MGAMDTNDTQNSPRKKVKLDHSPGTIPATMDGTIDDTSAAMPAPMSVAEQASQDQLNKEIACGITEFVSTDLQGFSGILKQRYTDFLVNEILPSGQVVHLTDLRAPKREQRKYEGSRDAESEPNAQEKALKDANWPGKSSVPAGQAPPPSKHKEVRQQDLKPEEAEQQDASIGEVEQREIRQQNTKFEEVEKEESKEMGSIFPARGNADPLAHHFEDSLPHKRADLPHLATEPHPSSSPKPSPSKEATRTRQQFHIRHTNDGWKEYDKGRAEPQTDWSVAAREATTTESTSDPPKGGNLSPNQKATDSMEVDQAGTASSPKASSQAQWQAYADPGGELSAAQPISDEDKATLLTYFNESVVDAICSLYKRILHSPHRATRDYGTVKSAVIDRQLRTKIHQDVRRIFQSRLETTTGHDGAMDISAMPPISSYNTRAPTGHNDRRNGQVSGQRNQQGSKGKGAGWGKPTWQELGGEYLHFTLYKENKDTMEAISWLAKTLKLGPRAFEFAGTKDRRAVSAQRVSVYRTYVNRMIEAGRTLKNAKIGDYEYRPHALQLGELTGNEFTITLRDCTFDGAASGGTGTSVDKAHLVVSEAIKNLGERGCLNYYGLQRFGTFSTGTDAIGLKMLQGDFSGAVNAILHYTPESLAAARDPMSGGDRMSMDDKARSHAIHVFQSSGKAARALADLPRKFSAESAIIRHLGGRPGQENDHLGALQGISRNLRLMYVHAYQSLVWNVAASERWSRFGTAVIAGDLVLVNEHTDKVDVQVKAEELDEDGEAIIQPALEDRATNIEDTFTRARALSKEEAESRRYTIFDIVLPTPGYDILYPANEISKFYEDFMASPRGGGLNPYNMRRQWKDISLSGSYRKILTKPGKDISFKIKAYEDDNEQFVETDMDRLNKGRDGPKDHLQLHAHHDFPITTANANGEGADGHEHNTSSSTGPNQDENALDKDDSEDDTEPSGGVRLDGKPASAVDDGKKIAVVLKLQLGSSQYATMALRELMKGGVKTYKPDFGGGR